MAKIRISKRTLDALQPREKPYVIYDEVVTGFGVRVAPSSSKHPEGLKTFLIEYRPGSGGRGVRSIRLAIGRYGAMTADEARKVARNKIAEVRHDSEAVAA